MKISPDVLATETKEVVTRDILELQLAHTSIQLSWGEGIRIRSDSVFSTRYLAWYATKAKRLSIWYSAYFDFKSTYPLPLTDWPGYPDDSFLILFSIVKQRVRPLRSANSNSKVPPRL